LQPNLQATCCKQYTIRLRVSHFKHNKAQRKLMRKWQRYLAGEWVGDHGIQNQSLGVVVRLRLLIAAQHDMIVVHSCTTWSIA